MRYPIGTILKCNDGPPFTVTEHNCIDWPSAYNPVTPVAVSQDGPRAGDTWEHGGVGRKLTRRHESADGWRFGEGPGDWHMDSSFTDGTLRLISRAPLAAVQGGEPDVYWAQYLPPNELPNSGPKVFKLGQVWAFSFGGRSGVVRIDADSSTRELLAHRGDLIRFGDEPRCYFDQSGRALNAILLCEPGCAPRETAAYYGTASPSPVAPTVQPATGLFDVLKREIDEALRQLVGIPPGRHWNAAYLDAIAKLEKEDGVVPRKRCSHGQACRVCVPRKAPEFKPDVDEWDLLEDVDVRWRRS